MKFNPSTSQRDQDPRRASVWRRLRQHISGTKLRVPIVWFRHRGFRSTDVFLGSYPRSGSTWLRFTLFEMLTGRTANFESVNTSLRGPGTHRLALPVLPGNGRFLSTHECYRADYRKAIYLVRDIRDVVSSEFWSEKERGVSYERFEDYLVHMLQGRKKYGSWQDHVRSWIESESAKNGTLMLIRYEDMRRDPGKIFAELLEFLGKKVEPDAICSAIANNSLQKMRAKEDALHSMPESLKFPKRPPRLSGEGRFVRSGRVGGWRENLSDEQVSLIEHHAGSMLLRLGYPLISPHKQQLAGGPLLQAVSP